MERLSHISKSVLDNVININIESFERINKICDEYSLMPVTERKFVNGMISYFKPKRILELGVALGGGSLIILNAIKNTDSQLVSVDIEKSYVNNRTLEVGYIVNNNAEIINKDQWTLHTGVDVSEIIEEEGKKQKFDFVIIDTAHIHPIESLNFISIMPFLNQDAVVLIQDISLYAMTLNIHGFWHVPLSEGAKIRNASKLLFDTLVGDKYKLPYALYDNSDKEKWNIEFSNMGVVQITNDTSRYIGNLFSMLEYPWGIYPQGLKNIGDIIKKYYSEDDYKQFKFALNRNIRLLYHKFVAYKLSASEINFNEYDKVIFYGAGEYLKWCLQTKETVVIPDEIWDKKAEEIKCNLPNYLNGYVIRKPQFDILKNMNAIVIIFIDKKNNNKIVSDILSAVNKSGGVAIHADDLYEMFI